MQTGGVCIVQYSSSQNSRKSRHHGDMQSLHEQGNFTQSAVDSIDTTMVVIMEIGFFTVTDDVSETSTVSDLQRLPVAALRSEITHSSGILTQTAAHYIPCTAHPSLQRSYLLSSA